MALFIKYRKKLLLPVTSILFVIGLINLYFIINITPRSNDECLWVPKYVNKDSTAFVFDLVKVGGVTWNAGIRNGDTLLAINGTKIKDLFTASNLIDRLARGDTANYTIKHGKNVTVTKVKIKKLINFGGLAVGLLAIIWLVVGFIVIYAKPDGRMQRLFYRIGVLYILFSTWTLIASSPSTNPIWQYEWLLILIDMTWSLAAVFLPFVYIHFFWLFPNEFKIIKKNKTVKTLYAIPIVLTVLTIIYKIIFVYNSSYKAYMNNIKFVVVVNILILIALIIGFVSLFRSYLKLNTSKERNSIFIILISYAIGLAALIYTSTLANVLADTIFNSPEYFMPIILIALLPISFGYSIFKYSLMDVTDVIKNAIMYGVATITVAGIYFFVIYILGQKISRAIASEYQGLIAAGIFIIFAIIFQSTKDHFQEIITRKFYPEQFAYRKVLLEFSNHISTVVGLGNILDSVTEIFVNSLKLEKFGIALRDEKTGRCSLRREKGFRQKKLTIENRQSFIESVTQEKIKFNQPVAIGVEEFEKVFPNDYQKFIEEGIYTVIPLLIKSKVIGLLLFGLKYSGSQFAGKDLDLLIAAANQTAVSLENARLYEAEAQKIKLDRELVVARKIQEKLLPQKVPQLPGLDIAGTMIPAMQVGGDYFDLIKVFDTKLFVVVGDVSGKGLSASFYMSKLQTMVKLYCTANKSPVEILKEINKNIYESIDKHWFITITVALFDIEKKVVKIARAGHTPLKLIRDGVVKTYIPKGIGVGLEHGPVFNSSLQEETFHLIPGDLFVFTSDGIEEAMNSKNELFGEDRLNNYLINNIGNKSAQVLNSVITGIKNFRNGIEPNDDVTLVLVRITKAIENLDNMRLDNYLNPTSDLT
ncbi:phosphoserine phosphatase RsbU [bacterium BMS3Abin04]|nr:phosphoserine phosphatase RsbU [bacterium BMS3Abin04]